MTTPIRERAQRTLETGEIYLTDAEPFAAFIVRITSPEMRERIAQTIRDVDRGQRLWGADVQDLTAAIFALITEETP